MSALLHYNKKVLNFILLACMCLVACTNNSAHKEEVSTPMTIERLDHCIIAGGDSFLASDGLVLYLSMMGLDSLPVTDAVDFLRQAPVTKVFGPDVENRLGSLDDIELQLGAIRERMSEMLPDVPFSHIYGIVTPYRQSIVVSDSIVLVGLNHYLGQDYPGYDGVPMYQRSQKTVSFIPRDVAESLVRIAYPFNQVTGTLLERMLYEGAVVEAVSRVAGIPEDAVLGIDEEQYNSFKANENKLWQWLAANNLLYSTNSGDIARLIDPAPSTPGFSPEIAGRAGRFMGYRILKSYLKNNPSATLPSLLGPDFYGDAQTRLLESRYSPNNNF